jgi:hypothetical protein
MGAFHMKALVGVVALSLGASACFRSQRPPAGEESPDAAMDVAADAMIDTPADAATPHDAAEPDARVPDVPVLGENATGMDVVLAFEQLLIRRCACQSSGPCAQAWRDQFDDASQTCVADAIEQAGASACAASGVRELIACWYEADCVGCRTAELTEDTPLADLVEESCTGDQRHAYGTALGATVNCTR